MKVRAFLLIAFSVLLIAAEDKKKDDKEAIQGTWQAVKGEARGNAMPDENVMAIKITISADKIKVSVGGNDNESTYKIDSTKKPKTIELTRANDQTNHGIYDLDGDTLKVCWENAGGDRPTKFETKPDTELRMITFKREKK